MVMRGGLAVDKDFLQRMARMDELVDHQDNCGHCHMQIVMAQTARDLLAQGNLTEDDSVKAWDEETKRRWQESKYFKLYQEEVAQGRDPHEAFKEKGWEM